MSLPRAIGSMRAVDAMSSFLNNSNFDGDAALSPRFSRSPRRGRRGSIYGISLLLALTMNGCVAPVPRVASRAAAQATEADRRRPQIPEKDRVLYDYRLGASALRWGDIEEAKTRFDDAISRIGGLIFDSRDAERARSLFSAESTKPFVGEPYERVMAYYYRGILYWREGQIDNARACFRSAQVIDSDLEAKRYDSDYVLLDYLEGFASAKLGADGSDSFARARQHAGAKQELPSYEPTANVVVFAEYGYGPRKYAGGQYGEQLRFYADDSPTRSARLVLDRDRRIIPLPAYDDLGYQAATRGGRVMDHILGNKASFKATTDVAGDVALAGSVMAHEQARRRERKGKDGDDANAAAIGLGVLGMIGKVASAATRPQADIRQWDNLPQRLSFAAVQLPPGEHRAKLEFLDREGDVLEHRTQTVILSVAPDDRDTVVFLSELKR